MGSFITENRAILEAKHYVRDATNKNYWFDFSSRKLSRYVADRGDALCLVINGDKENDDAFVLHYEIFKEIFRPEIMTVDRKRWVGWITNNILHLTNSNKAVFVGDYYNRFNLLGFEESYIDTEIEIVELEGHRVNPTDFRFLIDRFNRRYRDVAPEKRRQVSEKIARPGLISEYLKRLVGYRCQLCGTEGFGQRNGSRYAEAHHIEELHLLIPGSLCSENMIVVCAICHRKLHFANIEYGLAGQDQISVKINGEAFVFSRNIGLLPTADRLSQ